MLTGILFRVTTIARNWRQQSLLLAYGLPDAAPARLLGTAMEILPVPKWKASAHARVCDDAGLVRISLSRHGPSRLLRKHQRPELVLRRSISSLRTPLSTLRLQPHDRTCITRGRCGSYAFTVTDLHRLSSTGLPAHPSTISDLHPQADVRTGLSTTRTESPAIQIGY